MNRTMRKWICLLLAMLMIPWAVFAETAETETESVEAPESGEHTVECRT